MKSTSKKRTPNIVNLTVKRSYLTEREIERLMDYARQHARYGHREATMILVAYRHGRASLAAVGVWVLSAVLLAARVSAVAAVDRSEPAISPGGPLCRHGQASQRRASLPITLQARA